MRGKWKRVMTLDLCDTAAWQRGIQRTPPEAKRQSASGQSGIGVLGNKHGGRGGGGMSPSMRCARLQRAAPIGRSPFAALPSAPLPPSAVVPIGLSSRPPPPPCPSSSSLAYPSLSTSLSFPLGLSLHRRGGGGLVTVKRVLTHFGVPTQSLPPGVPGVAWTSVCRGGGYDAPFSSGPPVPRCSLHPQSKAHQLSTTAADPRGGGLSAPKQLPKSLRSTVGGLMATDGRSLSDHRWGPFRPLRTAAALS